MIRIYCKSRVLLSSCYYNDFVNCDQQPNIVYIVVSGIYGSDCLLPWRDILLFADNAKAEYSNFKIGVQIKFQLLRIFDVDNSHY